MSAAWYIQWLRRTTLYRNVTTILTKYYCTNGPYNKVSHLGKHVLRQDVRQTGLPEVVRVDVNVVRPQMKVGRRNRSDLSRVKRVKRAMRQHHNSINQSSSNPSISQSIRQASYYSWQKQNTSKKTTKSPHE